MSSGTTQPANGNSKATTMSPSDLGAKKPNTRLAEFRGFMEKMKGQMALALPKHLNADRMARIVVTEFSKNPELQLCSDMSIAAAVMTSSQLGLEIGVNGQAYIIPYKNKRNVYVATFVPGWKGLIDLVNRSGRSAAWTGAVFQGDEFDWALGDSPFVTHKPKGESHPDKLLYAYAIGRVNGSQWPVIECWDVKRIRAHLEKHNKIGWKHYAFENFEMYARKIVLLQVLKYLPTSVELSAAIDLANNEDEGKAVTIDAEFFTIVSDDVADESKTAGESKQPEGTK